MLWRYSYRADPRGAAIADRHYNRQKIGAPQFVPPGRCVVLYCATATGEALWVTSWPFAEYVKHRWAGAWINSCYRHENAAPGRAHGLILPAIAATRAAFGEPPALGMVTFIDRGKVRPTMVRGEAVYGRIYRMVGFEDDGETAGGLLALRLRPERMPPAERPLLELEAA